MSKIFIKNWVNEFLSRPSSSVYKTAYNQIQEDLPPLITKGRLSTMNENPSPSFFEEKSKEKEPKYEDDDWSNNEMSELGIYILFTNKSLWIILWIFDIVSRRSSKKNSRKSSRQSNQPSLSRISSKSILRTNIGKKKSISRKSSTAVKINKTSSEESLKFKTVDKNDILNNDEKVR